MWDLLVAILEVFMDSSIDTNALKRRARVDLRPEHRDFERAQCAAAEAVPTPTPMKRPATRRRLSKRTRRLAVRPRP